MLRESRFNFVLCIKYSYSYIKQGKHSKSVFYEIRLIPPSDEKLSHNTVFHKSCEFTSFTEGLSSEITVFKNLLSLNPRTFIHNKSFECYFAFKKIINSECRVPTNLAQIISLAVVSMTEQ